METALGILVGANATMIGLAITAYAVRRKQ
ncbi:hypothetical protein SAMN05216268_12674 [Streptomyces yunnanensis]|uniref:Uncharacterized protein n=1 Tax=Streptomyces yunnanensis TaxID=156453 RepID=A0A9X8N7S8_9ACTN|nr:hypothetical protein SAMN05216268_12674 [Streptomyces yunnanensis]